jgi:transposase
MPRRLNFQGLPPLSEVNERYKAATERHDRERLLAIRMGETGEFTSSGIAQALGRGRATIARWIKAYREEGFEGLLKRGNKGNKPRLSSSDLEALKQGLREGRWKTAKEIQMWLQQERKIDMKLSGVYYWLRRVMASWKVPRKSHKDQDPQEVERFKQEFVSKLESIPIPEGKPIHIWIEDEHRYGLISIVRRCWTLRGIRPKALVHLKRQWGYIYAAADVVNSKAEFLYTPTVSLGWTEAFLKQVVASDPQALHIIIWDRAGFHPSEGDSKIPESVHLLPLPPYSPELNPMESLWDPVKRKVANKAWQTLEEIEGAITEVLKPFWQSVQTVRSLLGDTWLTRGVAKFLKLKNNNLLLKMTIRNLLNPKNYFHLDPDKISPKCRSGTFALLPLKGILN